MSGATELSMQAFAFILTIAVVAAATDLVYGKIYNWLTLPALAAALLWGLVSGGLAGTGSALAGAGVALLAFGWMFALGFMGGGDVKILMALGAWGGGKFALQTAVLSIFLGGAMAAVLILARGRMGPFVQKMSRFVMSIVIRQLVIEPPKLDRKLKMPFGVPIACAAIWIAVANPFAVNAALGRLLTW